MTMAIMGVIQVLLVSLCVLVSVASACCCGKPRDCQDLQDNGVTATGVYTIWPEGTTGFQVRCDMTTDGGGWTVIQRRYTDTDFYKTWDEYQVGFGSLFSSHYLGNQQISMITKQGWYELRVDLRHPTAGTTSYAKYNVFDLGGWDTDYTLFVNGYSGTAGDSLTYHSGRKFTTKDKDNDIYSGNCAVTYTGAWWYGSCHQSNLNGDYGNNVYGKGINWKEWTGYNLSLGQAEMKIRRWVA